MSKNEVGSGTGNGKEYFMHPADPVLPPGWRYVVLAEVSEHSQAFLLFREDRQEPFALDPARHHFEPLTNLGLFNENYPHPHLPKVKPGWKRIALSRGLERVHLPGTTLSAEINMWVLGFEWHKQQGPAQTAFLSAQQRLQPQNL